jgi:hypothetical protein
MRCPICGGAGALSQTVRINAPGRPFELATVAEAGAILGYTSEAARPGSTVSVTLSTTQFDPLLSEISTRSGVRGRLRAAAERLRKRQPEPDPEPVPLGTRRYDLEDE